MKTPNASKGRTWRWIEYILLAAGLFGVGVWVGSKAVTAIWQTWQSRSFKQQIEQRHGENPGNRVRVPSLRENQLVGRLSIPRLKLTAMVREGTGEKTLDLAVGHIPGTALPGQTGNVGVAGHRDTLFRDLRHVRPNDVIQFETLDGKYAYRVESTEIVKPEDVGVLHAGPSPELTLVTCYPFSYIGSAPDRFIVKARQIPSNMVPSNVVSSNAVSYKDTPEPQPSKTTARQYAGSKVPFVVTKNHSRELAPGISLGLTRTDATSRRVNGWMWLMPDRRTIWLRDHDASEPVVFYGGPGGKRRELMITTVAWASISGYLLSPQP